MGPDALAKTLAVSGYKGAKFTSTKFIGITSGREFCYSVSFLDEHTGKDAKGKVFVQYNSEEQKITAEY
jgi:hypothetical protein